jgi:hypothetical protein
VSMCCSVMCRSITTWSPAMASMAPQALSSAALLCLTSPPGPTST